MTHAYTFETNIAAKEFVRARVDTPIKDSIETLGNGMVMRTYALDLGEGKFTNVYDLSYPASSVKPNIEIPHKLTSVFDYVGSNREIKAATGGGFFFLADQASAKPRELALNLAVTDSQAFALPVVDREAVLSDGKHLSVEHVSALGVVSINGVELSWSGSLTEHETDVKVFANGNSVITHVQSDATGNMRALDENSRYTPVIENDDTVDIGFIRRSDSVFVGANRCSTGGLDIFSHDVVIRMHERYVHRKFPQMRVRTIGNMALDGALHGGMSVGPMIDTDNFSVHPINKDKSLGSNPPFLEIPLARTVLFETEHNVVHLRLFDGRPGSPIFPGVTPKQASRSVLGEQLAWGCFLDPGQTAKLVVRTDEEIASYGNTHYLKWPQRPDEKYIWVPKAGRPVASMITLR